MAGMNLDSHTWAETAHTAFCLFVFEEKGWRGLHLWITHAQSKSWMLMVKITQRANTLSRREVKEPLFITETLCVAIRIKIAWHNSMNPWELSNSAHTYMYIPLKPSGYTSERNLVLISPFTKRALTITSRSNGMLCVTPKNKISGRIGKQWVS